ncbi:MAG TPA: hypothetical protein DDW50_20805 [Firmicutes bacterium]|jgi:protein-tyrosine phosphatase|nr:hypothetical protein [Bacillota bacterium]
MIDIHTHVLPGFDDGAPDLKTSVAMLQMAQEHQTTAVVVTPHVIEGKWFPSWQEIKSGYELLRQEALQSGVQIAIYPGAEVAMSLEILKLLSEPGPYCINCSRYLLVELPSQEIPFFADHFFFSLQLKGMVPILAHPERHPELAKYPEILRKWVEKGVITQMNGSSLLGRMGERVQATAELFLKQHLVHCIGSDAHGVNYRRPQLQEAAVKIIHWVGEKQAKLLLVENPKRIITDQSIDVSSTQEPILCRSLVQIRHWFQR